MAELLTGTESGIVEAGVVHLEARHVTALADGWAVVERSVIAERTADGTWAERVESPHSLTALTSSGTGVFLGTSTGEVLRYDGSLRPVPGFDRVAGRDQWHAVGSSKPYVRSMSTTVDGVLLANVHVGGIPRSTDGGETWEPTIDVDADVHQVLAHPERPEVAVAAAAVGLAISHDAGTNWTVRTDGLHGTYCRAVAVSGDTVFVSASTGPFTDRGAIYRGALVDVEPLERVGDWLDGNIDSGHLAAAGDAVAFGGPDGQLHVSDDGGSSWTTRDGVPPVTALVYSRT
ncbi:MAG TPA: hypothetical protein VMQ81_14105 [Acidimicrobiia bacterium]|nr:hypothetical protein [Acidimicrobiia bacterium]